MAMRALVFDLDGLILDTESSDFVAWNQVYCELGLVLPRERWLSAIGTDSSGFHPLKHLGELLGPSLDVEALQRRRRVVRDELVEALVPLPGVVDTLASARRLGLRTGVASSSPRSWVEGHLQRLGLLGRFEALRCSDDVERVKPDPALYLAAVEALGVHACEAVAFEDSPHGVAAAKAAGLFCVAVPGPMTRGLDFGAADLVLDSMAELKVERILG